jgi:uncharacterized protein YndB with AHSA1/START domain
MFRWIAGGCLVLAVLIAGVAYWGYRKASSFADLGPASILIEAPPERVFASIATAESLWTWRAFSGKPRMTRTGMLVRGDTILDENSRNPKASMMWVIDSVVPGKLVVSHAIVRTSAMPLPMSTRRDSVSAEGAMARLTTVIDLAAGPAASKMMLGALRLGSQAEQEKLKSRIEGKAVGRPDSAR